MFYNVKLYILNEMFYFQLLTKQVQKIVLSCPVPNCPFLNLFVPNSIPGAKLSGAKLSYNPWAAWATNISCDYILSKRGVGNFSDAAFKWGYTQSVILE